MGFTVYTKYGLLNSVCYAVHKKYRFGVPFRVLVKKLGYSSVLFFSMKCICMNY